MHGGGPAVTAGSALDSAYTVENLDLVRARGKQNERSVDVKGYSVDAKGCNVDAKGSQTKQNKTKQK
eukprot:3478038-Pyramimonas_sp.AAC.1